MDVRFERVKGKALAEVCGLYQEVIADMRARGLRQWDWDSYPTRELLERDVKAGRLYRACAKGAPIAAFALCADMEDEYARLSWQYGVKPASLHRVAVAPDRFDAAFVKELLTFAKAEALREGYDSLRLDACREDEDMLALFRGEMTREVGETRFENPDSVNLCFESPLSPTCPMLPVKQHPAFRHGEQTPWGGDGLKTVYHMDIPDERTGEAMAISAIDGLESTSDAGETLAALARREPFRLCGDKDERAFPLLLKLLCAKQPLSVQVHPNDRYAMEHEHKLGKTEAWVILHAEKDASILYGLKSGVTTEQLKQKLEAGADIEGLIDRVSVKAGDVYYMPSGMVHAIGGGILLYEIQQSSDVTYRLWDYNRVNAEGQKRPLHIRQSLDVIDPTLRGQRARMPEELRNGVTRLLDVPAFKLDCVSVNGEYELAPYPQGFRMLTALAGLLLRWQGDALELEAGESVVLPAACPSVTLTGVGRALLARE